MFPGFSYLWCIKYVLSLGMQLLAWWCCLLLPLSCWAVGPCNALRENTHVSLWKGVFNQLTSVFTWGYHSMWPYMLSNCIILQILCDNLESRMCYVLLQLLLWKVWIRGSNWFIKLFIFCYSPKAAGNYHQNKNELFYDFPWAIIF